MRKPTSFPSAHPVALDEVPGLDERLKASLHALDVSSLFGVQSAVWQHTGGGLKFDRDLCVCAPTGSGKTLAYALPLVQGLAGQKTTTRLRALVVVPTGDLAFQVARVFEPLCRAVGLNVGVNHGSGRRPSGRADAAAAETVFEAAFDDGSASAHDQLDVLVTPPGRLVAHLRETKPGFSLARLQYLVVDEADRILRQSYQNWTPQVVAASGARRPRTAVGELGASRRRLKKILISATLTRDPARLAGLFLHAPRMLAAAADGASPSPSARYLLPEGLTEAVVPVASGDAKPLALRALLQRTGDTPVIVFTASVEATHRLFLLLSSMDAAERRRDERERASDASTNAPSRGFRLAEYSSFAPQAARAEALRAFAAGDARVLIASDAATRGLDVDRVGAVVSYDAPTHLKTYVHRVGRTARAGLRGVAYTLCRPAKEAPFLAMTSKADLRKRRAPPARLALADEEMDEHRPALRAALVAVKLHLEADAKGVAAGGESGGSTAAARVAAAQACQNHLRSRASRLPGERRDVESRRAI